MASPRLDGVLGHIRQLIGKPAADDRSDGQLLHRFASLRDEAAFEALVRRHGPAVLGVCLRVLGHMQDAEDARSRPLFWCWPLPAPWGACCRAWFADRFC